MQVACLQAQLMQVKSQLAQNLNMDQNHQWSGNVAAAGQPMNPFCPSNMDPISPQSSLESIDHSSSSIHDGILAMQDFQSRENLSSFYASSKKRACNNNELGELQ